MYWSDAGRIEAAYLNGIGLLTETGTLFFAFALHDDTIYFTEWHFVYVSLFSPAAKLTAEHHYIFAFCLRYDTI